MDVLDGYTLANLVSERQGGLRAQTDFLSAPQVEAA